MPHLPLFPLGTVLCPGAPLPLRIFEPRYVEMLAALAGGPQPGRFGVVAIRAGHEVGAHNARSLHRVGCVAELREVERQADGSYAIATVGVERFALRGIVDDGFHRTPYHVGSVEWLPERVTDEERVADLARVVRTRLVGYRRMFGDETETGEVRTPGDATALSYRVAQLVALPIEDRQALLACDDTDARLALGARLLRREQVLVSTLQAVPGSAQAPPFSAN